MVKPFAPAVPTALSISATTTSASVELTAVTSIGTRSVRIAVLPGGSATHVFITWGAGAATATASHMPVYTGTVETFTIPAAFNYIAAITSSGSATVKINEGEGV